MDAPPLLHHPRQGSAPWGQKRVEKPVSSSRSMLLWLLKAALLMRLDGLPSWLSHDFLQTHTAQHNTTQHDTIQHNTTQWNTTQYNTTQQVSVPLLQAGCRAATLRCQWSRVLKGAGLGGLQHLDQRHDGKTQTFPSAAKFNPGNVKQDESLMVRERD